jgi:RNA polymerase sigma-70 factor (ECF subfamily)
LAVSTDDATLEQLASKDCPQETRAELALLAKALDRLSAAERIAWMLRHVEGLPLEEIAQECECSLATVKRRIAAAAKRIERFTARGRT